jgi:D-methionine transport system permease protein
MMLSLLLEATLQTIYMVAVASVTAALVGVPLGVVLYITRPGNILSKPVWHKTLGAVVNMTRSIPFIILMIAVIPFTRLLVGTSIGTNAAIVPLALAAMPFIARIVESSLLEINITGSAAQYHQRFDVNPRQPRGLFSNGGGGRRWRFRRFSHPLWLSTL